MAGQGFERFVRLVGHVHPRDLIQCADGSRRQTRTGRTDRARIATVSTRRAVGSRHDLLARHRRAGAGRGPGRPGCHSVEARPGVRRHDSARRLGGAGARRPHRRRRPRGQGQGERRARHGSGRHDPAARPDRRAHPPVPAPVQRDQLGRPGAARVDRAAHRARHRARRALPAGRLHHPARPRHRGSARRRRRHQAGHRAGHHPRAAPAGRHPRHRRRRQLRPQGLPPRHGGAAGRRRGQRRRRDGARDARADPARRRLGEALRRLSLGPGRRDPPCLLDRGDAGSRGRGAQQRAAGLGPRVVGRGHAARCSGRRGHHRARRRRARRRCSA